MTKIQAIRWFANTILNDKITITRKRFDNNWGMTVGYSTPRLTIPKVFGLNDNIDKQFRQNFVNRCKLAKGFSNPTLSILHECGHWETRSVFDSIAYDKFDSTVSSQLEYMENPYEQLATQWAICWLQVPANRKLAKEFEKEFFGH